MQNLAVKGLHLILRVIYRKSGSIINRWGSITSPRELEIQRSLFLGERARSLVSYLKPIILEVELLKRYGSIADGGYVIPVTAINHAKFFISGGIETNNEFEIELANLGIVGIQIDNSIDTPPRNHKNLSFKRATLGGKDGVSIDELLGLFVDTTQGILKLDIEGSEYAVLGSLESFSRFTAIIIELHNLFKIVEDKFWQDLKSILDNFSKSHSVVFVAPNNCCGFSNIGGVPIPNVLEVTWARNDLVSGKKFKKIASLYSEKTPKNIENWAQLDVSNIFPNQTL
jgi:hypothetical protein